MNPSPDNRPVWQAALAALSSPSRQLSADLSAEALALQSLRDGDGLV